MASVHTAHDGGRHRLCVDGEGGDACVRVFASGARFWKGQGRRCSGKGPGKECVRFLTRVGNVQGRGGICSQMCQRALTRKRTLLGGGTLEIGHGAPLERLAQLGDAHDGVGAVAIMVDAAEPVAGQTAKKGGVSTGVDSKAGTGAGAHLSEVTALPLSPSHSFVMPSAV